MTSYTIAVIIILIIGIIATKIYLFSPRPRDEEIERLIDKEIKRLTKESLK